MGLVQDRGMSWGRLLARGPLCSEPAERRRRLHTCPLEPWNPLWCLSRGELPRELPAGCWVPGATAGHASNTSIQTQAAVTRKQSERRYPGPQEAVRDHPTWAFVSLLPRLTSPLATRRSWTSPTGSTCTNVPAGTESRTSFTASQLRKEARKHVMTSPERMNV